MAIGNASKLGTTYLTLINKQPSLYSCEPHSNNLKLVTSSLCHSHVPHLSPRVSLSVNCLHDLLDNHCEPSILHLKPLSRITTVLCAPSAPSSRTTLTSKLFAIFSSSALIPAPAMSDSGLHCVLSRRASGLFFHTPIVSCRLVRIVSKSTPATISTNAAGKASQPHRTCRRTVCT
jgi:hypothetical protein